MKGLDKGSGSNLAENGSTIVGDGDIAIWRDQDLVQATGSLIFFINSCSINLMWMIVPEKS